LQLIEINRFPHKIAIYQKDLSNKGQDFSEYLLLSSFHVKNDCFSFHLTSTAFAFAFLFLQNSWVVHSYSVICKVHYG